jgi:hypothetical protein
MQRSCRFHLLSSWVRHVIINDCSKLNGTTFGYLIITQRPTKFRVNRSTGSDVELVDIQRVW